MKLLITLHFNSEMGGLHDNVRATALEAADRGYAVYVACRSGLFYDTLQSDGINVVETAQDDIDKSREKIINEVGTDIDLIHAHPGSSRKIAIRLHDAYDIPVIFHVHGSWIDSVEGYIDKLACVFAVSGAVKQKVITQTGGNAHKVHIIPNYSEYDKADHPHRPESLRISLITRLEKDKKRIIDEVMKLPDYLNETDEAIDFDVIGDGSLAKELMNHFEAHVKNTNVRINHLGWISDKEELKKHIIGSDLIIGPGRVAIDAYTLCTPVIVVGSQNYHGVINSSNWQHFVHANFGGYGSIPYEAGDIAADLELLLKDEAAYLETVNIGRRVVDAFFNKTVTLDKHFRVYEMVSKSLHG